jgi:hypothetical protein
MKTVRVGGKEVQVSSWVEFWQVVDTSKEKVELVTEVDDPVVNIVVDDNRFELYARSNWYRVNLYAKTKIYDTTILSTIDNAKEYWDYVNIRKTKGIYEVQIVYQSDYIGEPIVEIYFITTEWKSHFEEFLQPVNKIYRDIKRFFKTW